MINYCKELYKAPEQTQSLILPFLKEITPLLERIQGLPLQGSKGLPPRQGP